MGVPAFAYFPHSTLKQLLELHPVTLHMHFVMHVLVSCDFIIPAQECLIFYLIIF